MKTVAYTFRRKINDHEMDILVYDKKIEIFKRINTSNIPDFVINTEEDHNTKMLNLNEKHLIENEYNYILQIIKDYLYL